MTQTPSSKPPTPRSQSGPGGGTPEGLRAQAEESVGQVVDQVQQTAGQVTDQAKQQATSQLETQKGRAVDTLVSAGQALRQTGQHLQEQQQGGVAGYVEQAAEQVERATNYLRSRDVPQLLDDTEDLARRQSGLFLIGALALGFVGGRFLMSSSQRQRRRQLALSTPTQTAGTYGRTSGSPYTPQPEYIPAGRDPAHRPPGPIGTTGSAGLSTTPSAATLGADSPGASSTSGVEPWRRPEPGNA